MRVNTNNNNNNNNGLDLYSTFLGTQSALQKPCIIHSHTVVPVDNSKYTVPVPT